MIIVSIEQNKVVTTWEVVTADDYGIQCGQSIDRLSSNLWCEVCTPTSQPASPVAPRKNQSDLVGYSTFLCLKEGSPCLSEEFNECVSTCCSVGTTLPFLILW